MPRPEVPPPHLMQHDADVIVIGAGFAGLAAAAMLREGGARVLVLEAQDRVGGRVEAVSNGLGERVDLGGAFFCEDMPAVTALARAQAKTFVEPRAEGETLMLPPLPPNLSPDEVWRRSGALRERVEAVAPGSGDAGLSVAEWVRRQPDEAVAKAAFLSTVAGLWCVDPERLPLWFLADNDRRVTNEVYELQYFLAETMASLAEDMARPLGGALRLGTPVETVGRSAEGVSVEAGGHRFSAHALIVAVPPVAARRIRFSPPLEPDLRAALEAWAPGTVAKLVLRYARPFWRERNLSGTVAWRDPAGLYAVEASRDEASLVLFIGGPTAAGLHGKGDTAIEAFALERLREALGAEAARPLDVAVRDWTGDPWSAGGYADLILDPTAEDAENVLRRGHAPIQFACSEISPSFPGYVEGAIVAGRLAAERVLRKLPAVSTESGPQG